MFAVADLFRWGNRWYVSTRFDPEDFHATQLLQSAHSALVTALVLLLVAVTAAVVGWRLRIVRSAHA